MTDQQILQQAIRKAIDNRWQPIWRGNFKGVSSDLITGEMFAWWQYEELRPYGYSVIGIIFNHDFAKALWPGYVDLVTGKHYETRPHGFLTVDYYIHHLQQMVIADNPLKYLGENL